MAIDHSSNSRCGEDILQALADGAATADRGLTVAQLAAVTGRDRGLLARVVADLMQLGLVDDVGSRRTRLGWALYVAAARLVEVRLETRSPAILNRLSHECQEGAWVVVRRGAQAVSVAESSPKLAVGWVSWLGRGFPVARSDAGPVLLQELSPEQLRGVLGDGPLPETSARRAPHSLSGLERLIQSARDRGVCILDEQAEAGVASVAAPVRDFRGRIVAAVDVSGPAVRLWGRWEDVAERVLAAAAELSSDLGGRE